MDIIVKALVTMASAVSVGFGIWHFFVPKIWNWNAYMDARATELILAVRAINVFFSISLVLFGLLNWLFVTGVRANRYSIIALLAATSILWLVRLVIQVRYPQGSMNPLLQYGMLLVFFLVFFCYIISLGIIILKSPTG
jgi:hypothetical protein